MWNSHAYNVTDKAGKLDIWVNLEFAAPEEQRYPLQRFTDIFQMFSLAVPAFGAQEMCAHYVVPPRAAILELSSHNHKRGKRFRIWEGAFSCAGGPHVGRACSPTGVEPGLGLEDPCDGSACLAPNLPRVGDCDRNERVTVEEILLGVNIALGARDVDACQRFDGDADGAVRIDELLAAIDALLNPSRDADDSLLYTSLTYSDPAVAKFDPPLQLGGADSSDEERMLTYCSLYDNGATDPAQVKRQSTSPRPTAGFPGGPCPQPVGCVSGLVGAACSGSTPAQRDRSCDSSAGAGDGDCDACPVAFGTTTEDEMFILLGAYYVE